MWTVKEAYTKALGLGLGFDFKRVEFNTAEKTVKIDGLSPAGWSFTMFTVPDRDGAVYEGIVAEFVGGDTTQVLDSSKPHPPWLKLEDAHTLLQRALDILPSFQR